MTKLDVTIFVLSLLFFLLVLFLAVFAPHQWEYTPCMVLGELRCYVGGGEVK